MNVNTITVTGPRSGVAALYPLHNPAAGVGGVKTSPLLSPAPVAAQHSTVGTQSDLFTFYIYK